MKISVTILFASYLIDSSSACDINLYCKLMEIMLEYSEGEEIIGMHD